MTSEYATRIEEGVTLPPFTLEFTEWIQRCFDLLEAGEEDKIFADPFFDSGLTEEKIDEVVTALDAEYAHELGTYPSYHRNRSGATATPDFWRLSPRGRRAMVEGMLRIKHKYETPGG